jgi:hypothetical protein
MLRFLSGIGLTFGGWWIKRWGYHFWAVLGYPSDQQVNWVPPFLICFIGLGVMVGGIYFVVPRRIWNRFV